MLWVFVEGASELYRRGFRFVEAAMDLYSKGLVLLEIVLNIKKTWMRSRRPKPETLNPNPAPAGSVEEPWSGHPKGAKATRCCANRRTLIRKLGTVARKRPSNYFWYSFICSSLSCVFHFIPI